MDVVVYDGTGSYDTFRVVGAGALSLQLQHTMTDSAWVYAAGAKIVEATRHAYYWKSDAVTDAYQLRRDDGAGSDAVVADHVVGLAFEYYGDPSPPIVVKLPTDPIGPWTSYGPRPPQSGAQPTSYPPGENCVFQLDATGLQYISRLAPLGEGTTLVRLAGGWLSDGPWCPDPESRHRYDADLLRIRKVTVTLRVEAAVSALRGPTGRLFARGGTSRSEARWVPDREVRFDVVPRNLGAGR
jgi:hypothetical protein